MSEAARYHDAQRAQALHAANGHVTLSGARVVRIIAEILGYAVLAVHLLAGVQHLYVEPSPMTIAPDSKTITVLAPDEQKARREARKLHAQGK